MNEQHGAHDRDPWHRRAVGAVGVLVLAVLHDVGGQLLTARAALACLLRGRIDGRETLRHVDRFGVGSLPLVLGGSVVVGGIVAMQGLGYISRYNATDVFGWASAVSAFREVGPLLLGLTLAARLGAKNTAELASMQARERLDAVKALGLDVTEVVVAPRLCAIVLSTVLVYPLCTITVLWTAFGLAAAVGDQRWSASVSSLLTYVPWTTPLQGLFRLACFGVLIAVSSSWFGTRGGRDARAIGQAVYAQSVASLSGVVVLNLTLTLLGGA
ncbi:MAG: MlaE family ABC transporter permease [Myxococcota bacterium]